MFYNYNFFAKYFEKLPLQFKVDKKLSFCDIFLFELWNSDTLYNYICQMMLQSSFL
jgi:hypothetical protein